MRRFVKDFLLPMAVAVALAFVIQAAVAKPYEIPTESMVPTIKANDRIIANRLIYRFRDIAARATSSCSTRRPRPRAPAATRAAATSRS